MKHSPPGQMQDPGWLEIPDPLIQLKQIIEFRMSSSCANWPDWKDLFKSHVTRAVQHLKQQNILW